MQYKPVGNYRRCVISNNDGTTNDRIERAAAVAADYEGLQGITSVGIGIGCLVIALFDVTFGAVVIAMSAAVGQGYYYKKYGKVRRGYGRAWQEIAAALLLAMITIPALLVDHHVQTVVLTAPLAMAVGFWAMFTVNYRYVGKTTTHLVVLAILALSSLLPLTGTITGANFFAMDLALLGLAFTVVGIVDHIRLTRAMGPANAVGQ